MTTTPAPAPAWARGYPVEELRRVAQVHRAFDKPYALGAFSNVKENTVAEWLAAGELVTNEDGSELVGDTGGSMTASVQVVHPERLLQVRDFTGTLRASVRVGAAVFRHPAALEDAGLEFLLDGLRRRWPLTQDAPEVWLEGWMESPEIRLLAREAGLELVAVKIKASSELVGVWGSPGYIPSPWPALPEHDRRTLVQLTAPRSIEALREAAEQEVQALAQAWADHYSSYNARHAWSALGLTAYTAPGEVPDPLNIVKPAEMARAWKAEHPGWEEWQPQLTELGERLPAVARLALSVQAHLGATRYQRVRLMRLQPGGGELTRHADITDPDAGLGGSQVARIHVPITTNEQVLFRQWTLEGAQVEAHMAPGSVWYLDTRKPHRAGNYGTSERVHLVMDLYGTDQLRELVERGLEAEEVDG